WDGIKDAVAAEPESSSIPMTTLNHAFALKPGNPSLQRVMASRKEAVDAASDVAKWRAANGATPLTDAMKEKLLVDVYAEANGSTLQAMINSQLPQNPTVEDMMEAFAKVSSQPDARRQKAAHSLAKQLWAQDQKDQEAEQNNGRIETELTEGL